MTASGKKISIIVPCYNVERYIDRCINSLVNQTIGIECLQLIFVDDASTDRTGRKLLYWQKKYPDSIEIYTLPENRRQGGARNEGLRHAVAPCIGFVDSDDWVAVDMYERLYEALQREQCDFVDCCMKRVVDAYEPLNSHVFEDRCILVDSEEKKHAFLVERLPGGVCSKLFRANFLQQAAPEFPEQTAYEDNYWMAMVRLAVNRCYVIGRELYYYYVNPQSTILSVNSERHLQRLTIEEAKLAEYRRRGIFEKYYREFEFEFLRLYYINSLHTFFMRMSELGSIPFAEMQKKVRQYFPDYKNNPYLARFMALERELLSTVELELDLARWELLAENYRRVMKANAGKNEEENRIL